jgi:hypothetical protein
MIDRQVITLTIECSDEPPPELQITCLMLDHQVIISLKLIVSVTERWIVLMQAGTEKEGRTNKSAESAE